MRAASVIFLSVWALLALLAGMFLVDSPVRFLIALAVIGAVSAFFTRPTANTRQHRAQMARRRDAQRIHLGPEYRTRDDRYDVFSDTRPE